MSRRWRRTARPSPPPDLAVGAVRSLSPAYRGRARDREVDRQARRAARRSRRARARDHVAPRARCAIFSPRLRQRGKLSDVIGFHGQTVLHRPHLGLTVQQRWRCWRGRQAFRCPRHARQRHGVWGQGAPLVPAYHAALAHSLPAEFAGDFPDGLRQYRRHLQHYLRAARSDPVAFDTGPGNTLIDQWVAREGVPFDAGGAIASEGGRRPHRCRALSRQQVLREERSPNL